MSAFSLPQDAGFNMYLLLWATGKKQESSLNISSMYVNNLISYMKSLLWREIIFPQEYPEINMHKTSYVLAAMSSITGKHFKFNLMRHLYLINMIVLDLSALLFDKCS